MLREDRRLVEAVLTYKDMSLLSEIKKTSEIIEEEYLDNGVRIKAFVSNRVYGRILAGNKK